VTVVGRQHSEISKFGTRTKIDPSTAHLVDTDSWYPGVWADATMYRCPSPLALGPCFGPFGHPLRSFGAFSKVLAFLARKVAKWPFWYRMDMYGRYLRFARLYFVHVWIAFLEFQEFPIPWMWMLGCSDTCTVCKSLHRPSPNETPSTKTNQSTSRANHPPHHGPSSTIWISLPLDSTVDTS